MQTGKEHIETLWNKWLSNEATPEELDQLLAHIDAADEQAGDWNFIREGFAQETPEQARFVGMEEAQKIQLLQNWQALRTPAPAPVRRFSMPWRWAAAVILLLGTGAFLWRWQHSLSVKKQAAIAATGIAPGKNGAVLTLADGTELVLDSAGTGVIASQGGAQVVLKEGQLTYEATTGTTGAAIAYNTMHTPRGRQFQLLLPDGTKVWLNSASTLRYPTTFNGKERKVEVTGEAYFDVAQHATMPFRVNIAGKAEVEVLGTEFNVNAYDNGRHLRTTLLAGSIRVRNQEYPGQAVLLKQGQQAVVAVAGAAQQNAENITVVNHIDIDRVTAWKNGLFNFDGMSLQEAMQQLERWYDIEVSYENGIPEIPFGGEMSRNVSLDGLLKMLADAGLSFRIEKNRKLIITNK